MPRPLAWLSATLAAVPAALWINRHEGIIGRHGRPLHPAEERFARSVGVVLPKQVRVLAQPRIPAPLGGWLGFLETRTGFSLADAAGVTLGYGIYLNARAECPALVHHELVHVAQYERLGGSLPFIWRYFYECLAFGYHGSPLEREAVERSKD